MSFVRALIRLLPIVAVLAGLTVTVAAENWPQWRGPGGQGVSTDSQAPTEWAPDKNIAWKAELPGTGMSSPIIWGDRIYLTAVLEGDVVPGQRAVKHKHHVLPAIKYLTNSTDQPSFEINRVQWYDRAIASPQLDEKLLAWAGDQKLACRP